MYFGTVSAFSFAITKRQRKEREKMERDALLEMKSGGLDDVSEFTGEIFNISSVFGFLAIALAAINIFGGFLVTMRMLKMYKKGKKK